MLHICHMYISLSCIICAYLALNAITKPNLYLPTSRNNKHMVDIDILLYSAQNINTITDLCQNC